MMMNRLTMLSIFGGLMLFSALAQAQTQAQATNTWPNKPIRIIVPYAAGGPIDVTARVLILHFSSVRWEVSVSTLRRARSLVRFGQPVVAPARAWRRNGGFCAASSRPAVRFAAAISRECRVILILRVSCRSM